MRPVVIDSPRVSFSIADRRDDSALCSFAARYPSGGSVQLALDTTPSYLAAQSVGSVTHETLVAKSSNGEILAVGNLSVRRAYVNGLQTQYTYLSGLRIMPEQRGNILLARGYEKMRSLALKNPATFTVSTIFEENTLARKILESGRAGLPRYTYLGSYSTIGVSTFSLRQQKGRSKLHIRCLNESELQRWISFVNERGALRNFFPVIEPDLFQPEKTVWKDLSASDVWIAENNDTIVGTLALWNQNRFRRWSVHRYRSPLKYLRPLYNFGGRIFSQGILPPLGGCLDMDFVSLVCIERDDPVIFDCLLQKAARTRPKGRMLFAGFHESDPLFQVAMRRKSHEVQSRVYQIDWENGNRSAHLNKNLPIHQEIGTL